VSVPLTTAQPAAPSPIAPAASTNGSGKRAPNTTEITMKHPATGKPVQMKTGGVQSGTLTAVWALCKELDAKYGEGQAKEARELFCEKRHLLPTNSTLDLSEAEATEFVMYLKGALAGPVTEAEEVGSEVEF
jgi:hypothetical protein